MVALGMLAGPVAAGAWFGVAAPTVADRALPGTLLVAALLAGGAAAAGATQIGVTRAWTTTLGAALFGALVTVLIGAAAGGDAQTPNAPPAVVHAAVAALAGAAGAALAAVVAALVARGRSLTRRLLPALLAGVTGAIGVTLFVLG